MKLPEQISATEEKEVIREKETNDSFSRMEIEISSPVVTAAADSTTNGEESVDFSAARVKSFFQT